MTLVKNKARISQPQRKLAGQHHHKSQKYLRTYWPYIPIFLALGGSLVLSELLPTSFGSHGLGSNYSARIESLTGNSNSNLLIGLYFILAILAIWFLARHFKRFKAIASKSEHYLTSHYSLDITLGLVIGGLFFLIS